MAENTRETRTPTKFDWLLLCLIVVVGGSSLGMIRGAVETLPPPVVGAGRLWVGACVLYCLMRTKGRRFPKLLVVTPAGRNIHRAWAYMIAIGALGNTLPFLIFPWAQQFIDSGLAGIYMAVMPIWTLMLAYFFTDEKMTGPKLTGFALGFLGVVILMGPSALTRAAEASLLPQLSLLLATLFYAAAAILVRRAPTIRPRVFSAGIMLSAAILSTPSLLFADMQMNKWSVISIVNVVGLGLGPTGLAIFIIIILIKRTSASFMALANYITPFWAVAVGAIFFDEKLPSQAFIALGIILLGVAISQGQNWRPAPMIRKT